MDEWHIGDPVDWGDGWMDAQNWGRRYDDNEETGIKNIETDNQYSERDVYSKKAWDYYLDNEFSDALYYINLALDLDRGHSNNWNKKAIILEYMGRYEESEKCYNKSLELRQQSLECCVVGRAIYFLSQEMCQTDWQSWKKHWKKIEKLLMHFRRTVKKILTDSLVRNT